MFCVCCAVFRVLSSWSTDALRIRSGPPERCVSFRRVLHLCRGICSSFRPRPTHSKVRSIIYIHQCVDGDHAYSVVAGPVTRTKGLARLYATLYRACTQRLCRRWHGLQHSVSLVCIGTARTGPEDGLPKKHAALHTICLPCSIRTFAYKLQALCDFIENYAKYAVYVLYYDTIYVNATLSVRNAPASVCAVCSMNLLEQHLHITHTKRICAHHSSTAVARILY